MKIELVVFSLDDTLIEIEHDKALQKISEVCKDIAKVNSVDAEKLQASVQKHADELFSQSPVHEHLLAIGIDSINALFRLFEHAYPNLETIQEWSSYYRNESWRRALKDQDMDDPEYAEECAIEFLLRSHGSYSPYPEVVPVLESLLRQGRRLAIISNGESDVQAKKVFSTNLEKYFELIVISENVGIRKPDKRIFDFTLNTFNVLPAQAVMVGDNPDIDIDGAVNASMKTVLIHRKKEEKALKTKPNAEISSLFDLIDVLDELDKL